MCGLAGELVFNVIIQSEFIITVHQGLLNQRRAGCSFEGSFHEVTEEVEGILPLELTGSGDGEDSFREPLTFLGLIAKAKLSPLDGGTDSTLHAVFGRLHPFMGEEGEEMVPVVEQALGTSAHLRIRAVQVLLAVPFHSSSHQGGGIDELLSRNVALAETMPATEDPPRLLEHVL